MPKVLFSRDNAGEMARRANAVIKAKRAMLRESPPVTPSVNLPRTPDRFVAQQLSRVRKQISMLNDRIDELAKAKELDSQGIDRLASAITRLRESERILRNQPLPGSYKPVAQRQRKTYQSAPQADIETRTSVEPTTGGVPPQPQ